MFHKYLVKLLEHENENSPSKIISPNCAKVVAVTVFGTGSDLANAFLQNLYHWTREIFMSS